MKTHNNDDTNYNAGNPFLDFFSKAGSLYEKRKSFYKNEASALDLFKSIWSVDKEMSFKLLLWCRDIRGGSGNRSGSRAILNWVANFEPEWVKLNLPLIPHYGRWDDLLAVMNTPVEEDALILWSTAISNKDGLACKWAPRENKANKEIAKKLRKYMGINTKAYRKLLAENTNVVESTMCNRKWNEIDYSKVPSVAISRYNKSFNNHDTIRYGEWKNRLVEGKETVNTGAIYPHDCFRTFKSETRFHWGYGHSGAESKLANAQFEQMPNYFSTDMRAISIVDISGSMSTLVSGSIAAIDIAVGLGLYASDRLGKNSPFYRKLIPFSSDASFYNWKDKSFCQGAMGLFNEHIHYGSTNIAAALKLILNTGSMFNVTNEQMPNTLIIISDMQFDANPPGNWSNIPRRKKEALDNSVESVLKQWDDAGYTRPNIVYWNTAGYAGSPATAYDSNVALISGFSPSILKAVFDGKDFSPMAILNRTIEKYKISIP